MIMLSLEMDAIFGFSDGKWKTVVFDVAFVSLRKTGLTTYLCTVCNN